MVEILHGHSNMVVYEACIFALASVCLVAEGSRPLIGSHGSVTQLRNSQLDRSSIKDAVAGVTFSVMSRVRRGFTD